MTTVAWSMSVNGLNRQSLSAWSIKGPKVTFRSLDNDDFIFSREENILTSPAFAFGDKIILYRNAVIWFQGIVAQQIQVGSGQLSEVHYLVRGPWWQMSRVVWQANTQFYDPNSCQPVTVKQTKAILFQDPTTGDAITTGQQITNAVDYCLTGLALPILIVAGTVPPFISVPMEEVRDIMVTDIIRRCMQWTPDGVSWIDYTSATPVFNCQERIFLSTVTIDISQKNLVSKLELFARDDLVPTGVRFNYIGFAFCNVQVPNGCADPSTGIQNTSGHTVTSKNPVQVSTLTQDVAGIPDAAGGLIGTIDLTQLTATTSETAPLGMAGEYYLSLITPTWEGSITTQQQECTGILRPGLVLNLSNGNPAWATMDAQIQEVSEELYNGITECKFGPPNHLLPQDFVNLLQLTRRRPLITDVFAAVAPAGNGAGGPNCVQGINPSTNNAANSANGNGAGIAANLNNSGNGNNLGNSLNTCELEVCQGGQLSPLKVYCPPQ